ncbi:hypothetical protein ACFQ1Q_12745 [Winogradskyella litorisediminis]|uniref:GLPGLI family protein n=1 Tax=Winogradskyella litorisediminis TaxID=1156618 RepID=A0ABW3NB25_9FLAO
MKQNLFIISFLLTVNVFGQKSDIEILINQIAKQEVPKHFDYYYLVPKSLEQRKVKDSLQNYEINELQRIDKNFPQKFINTKPKNEIVSWQKYSLENAKLVSVEYDYYKTLAPPNTKRIKFVRYNIEDKELDSLIENKEPYSLIVKKKWLWSKNRIWKNKKYYDEVINIWKTDDINNPEQTVYFHFSKPIFSKNKKYALVSVLKSRRCSGSGFTALYRNDKDIWNKVKKFNRYETKSSSSHIPCEDIRMTILE